MEEPEECLSPRILRSYSSAVYSRLRCSRSLSSRPSRPLSESRVAESLPELGADIGSTSVSGLSSGAYMAEQIEVAHSKDIKGAGIVAGGPYACAETEASRQVPFWPSAVLQNAQQALNQCMQTTAGTPDPKALAKRAEELAADGKIDPLAGLADDNVYLFSGNEDQTVTRPVVEAAAEFLKDAGVAATNLTLVEKEGGHAFITEQGGAACGITATPFVSDCDYDQAKGPSSPGSMGRSLPPKDRPRAASSCSTSSPSPSPATGSPTRAWSMSLQAAPKSRAAASISRCMAASNRVRQWATTSSRSSATRRSPMPIGLSSSFRRRRRSLASTPKAAGIGGAIPG